MGFFFTHTLHTISQLPFLPTSIPPSLLPSPSLSNRTVPEEPGRSLLCPPEPLILRRIKPVRRKTARDQHTLSGYLTAPPRPHFLFLYHFFCASHLQFATTPCGLIFLFTLLLYWLYFVFVRVFVFPCLWMPRWSAASWIRALVSVQFIIPPRIIQSEGGGRLNVATLWSES